jgi:hypothetical protein
MECQVRELYFGDVNGYLKLRMICYKLCKNEACSLLCEKTLNEIIFKMVDYLYPLVIQSRALGQIQFDNNSILSK